MLILNGDEVRKLCPMREAMDSDREAFILQAQGKVQLPVRTNFSIREGGISSFMPAFVSSIPQAGIKIVSTFRENAPKNLPVVSAMVLLLDPETGMVSAMIDGTELTRLRTGAVSGLATELLSNGDAETGALFGTGGQAMCQLRGMLSARKLSEVRIYDSAKERILPFIREASALEECAGTRLVAAESPDAAILRADVITTVTTSAAPVFDGSKIKDGAHVNAVGNYSPTGRELDGSLMMRAGRIFVDNMEGVLAEAGELLIPMSEGKLKKKDIGGELGDLLLGKVPGRTSREQITVMKAVGFATLDIVLASRIHDKAVAMGIGAKL